MSESDSVKIKKSSLWKISTLVLVVALVVVLIVTSGGSATGNAVNAGTKDGVSGSAKVDITNADPVLGDPNAEVTIVEFSDFQCPFCERAAHGALEDLKNSEYFSSGQVNVVYKHFPLNSIHPYAQKAGEAAECANRQGMFWEYHDVLFNNQDNLDTGSLKSYAVQLGLDSAEFNSCLNNNEAQAKVVKDTKEATSAGARGTPYFVVLNTKTGETEIVSGAVPFANFEAAINAVM